MTSVEDDMLLGLVDNQLAIYDDARLRDDDDSGYDQHPTVGEFREWAEKLRLRMHRDFGQRREEG